MNLKTKSARVLDSLAGGISNLLSSLFYLLCILTLLAIPVGMVFIVMHFIVKFW